MAAQRCTTTNEMDDGAISGNRMTTNMSLMTQHSYPTYQLDLLGFGGRTTAAMSDGSAWHNGATVVQLL